MVVLIGIIALVVFLGVPNYLRQRETIQRNACIAQLQSIAAAKERWGREKNQPHGAVVDAEALRGLFKNALFPVCPAGGAYTVNPVGAPPSCSLADAKGHKL
jgi:competence protein ComGC